MAKYRKNKITILFGRAEEDKVQVDAKVHESGNWAIHHKYSFSRKEYEKEYSITLVPVGVALRQGIKGYKEAKKVLEDILKEFPALEKVSSQAHWDIIRGSYGNSILWKLNEINPRGSC